MTLILTTICNERKGLCVCADTRYGVGIPPKYIDGYNKIYKFQDKPIIIFNHGINEFQGKPWLEFCNEYEKTNTHANKNMYDIANDFKKFVEGPVSQELQTLTSPPKKETYACGFVICGYTDYENQIKVNEVYFSAEAGKVHYTFVPHKSLAREGVIRSGNGKEYLEEHLRSNTKYLDPAYWENMSMGETKKLLKEIFKTAVKEQEKPKWKDKWISDDFKTASIVM